MRVSESMRFNSFLRDLQDLQDRLFRSQREVISGRKLDRPSDGPVETARVVRIRDEVSQINQYYRNIGQARIRVASAGEALNSVRNLLNRVTELGNRGLSDTLRQADRDAVATEVEEILNELVRISQAHVDGKRLFSGSQVDTDPVVLSGGSYTYQGDGVVHMVEIAKNRKIATNVPGSQIFTDASAPLLDSVQGLANALRASDTNGIRTQLQTLEQAAQLVDTARVRLMTAENQLEVTKNLLDTDLVNLTREMSALQDANIAESISRMVQNETSLRATLATGARLSQMNLFDIIG